MPKLLPFVALALVVSLGTASAADMANRSRLGQVFAEPQAGGGRRAAAETVETVDPGWVRNSPRVAGYYGQAGDFHYRNYYGTPRSLLHIYSPFTCVVEALC
ncbi:hypothetical protein [Tardiphaga sp.]|uniref:hypothetical protein n=1 Tax=Tardiphaga sp. TaxID=1926292 RepID=UPI00261857F1|nr:hypothetical protein [Tardiphaga sp.]MDB5619603.1 hypothetical protein [Tardiphaga sp.]